MTIRNIGYKCHVYNMSTGNYLGQYNGLNDALRTLVGSTRRDRKFYNQNAKTCMDKLKQHGYVVEMTPRTPPRTPRTTTLHIEQPLQIEHKPLLLEYKSNGENATMNTPKLDYIINTPCNIRGLFAEHIKCNDGATISVQCSSGHYCDPRNDNGPWTECECWTNASTPECMDKYCSDKYNDGYIYAYIPVEHVREFIALHGGEKR